MKHLMKSFLFILLVLVSCKNGKEENINNYVDSNASFQNKDAEDVLEKQAPTFTPSEIPFQVQYRLGISSSFLVILELLGKEPELSLVVLYLKLTVCSNELKLLLLTTDLV